VYGFLMVAHIAYGLFFATAIVCLIRGLFHWSLHWVNAAREKAERDAPTASVTSLQPTARTEDVAKSA
jgi:hypothetical protein